MILENKRILVTGATGFVGSHLVKRLLSLGNTVYSVSISSNPQSFFFDQRLNERSVMLPVDLCDFEKIKDVVSKYTPDLIFHLGAQPLVHVAYLHPHRTLETNIMGTVNILEAARLFGTPGVILASSDKAYGKHGNSKYTEWASLQGDHPYEVSKSSADLIAQTYAKTYKLPVVVSRFGNIYGPGDLNFSRIIPGIMESIIRKKPLQMRSDGSMIRDYLHVEDVVEGYISLAENLKETTGEAFNFGSDETLSVLEVISRIEKAVDKKIEVQILNNEKNEIPYQSLDFSKAKKMIGWEPKQNIAKSAKQMLSWYRQIFNV